MKKILSLCVLLAVLSSCEEDVKFNTPAVQALKDREKWKADSYTAVMGGDMSLTITAVKDFETLTLHTDSFNPGVYDLGENSENVAGYHFAADSIIEDYTTDDSDGLGRLIITETNVTAGYIVGTFAFTAIDSNGNEVSFTNGNFYRIPLTSVP